MKTRYKIISIVAGIAAVLLVSNFVIDYKLAGLPLNADDTPYDLEVMFDEEEYSVTYLVVNGITDYTEIDIPYDMIDGVAMVYVNGQNIDDERIRLDGNKVLVSHDQNIKSVKLIGIRDLSSISNQECAELFDKIHQETRDKPCACCNPPPGKPVCEPESLDSVFASNKEFRDSGCEFTYKEWIHLTSDIEAASWVMYPSYFSIDMLKTNLSKEIPIALEYRGYDECLSFQVTIKQHEGSRPVVAERLYENVCSANETEKKYRLPLYRTHLTDYGEPIVLPKGNYQMLLYNVIDGQMTDEESKHVGQFFFSSHYDHESSPDGTGYDYSKPASEILRDTRCAEWFDKIMQTGKDLDSEFGLMYELRETNVFRDLRCASFVAEWEPLTKHDVEGIGIPWDEIASSNEE